MPNSVNSPPGDSNSGQPDSGRTDSGQPLSGQAGPGRSQAERVYLALRDEILSLRLAPGTPVQEEPLTRQLGTGRTPFREAVKRLEAESLIVIYPRRGSFVTEVNITDHALIADVRRRLEGHAARRAAERATGDERAELERLCGQVRDHAGAPIMDLDTNVHRTLYKHTHNRYLENTLGQYYNLALRIWCLFFDRLPDVSGHVAEHAELLKAVIAGDGDEADRLAVAHVDHFEQAIRDAL